MNFLYVQLSREILMFVAQDGGRMILLTQQVKKSALSHYQLDINNLLINLPMPCIDLLFCTNQNTTSNYASIFIELMFQFLINVTITLFLTRLTFVYHSLQHISAKFGNTVKQTWKMVSTQYLILIGVKLLNIFP